MMDENEVIERPCAYLEGRGYQIKQRLSAGDHGIDVIAEDQGNSRRLLVEVKGGTSSAPGSNRYGKPYTPSQVFDVVAKGFHQILQRHLELSGRQNSRFGFACPDTPDFRKYLAPIVPVAQQLGIMLFLVEDSGRVSELEWTGRQPDATLLAPSTQGGASVVQKRVDAITKADIDALIANSIGQRETLEYKEVVRGGTARPNARRMDHPQGETMSEPVEISECAVLFRISKTYRSDMTAEELYEATRGFWRIGEKRNHAELAFAVYQGVIREVYRIRRWLPAGTLTYKSRDAGEYRGSGRWEFEGEVAQDVRGRYVGKVVAARFGQNPVCYVNL